MTPPIGANRPAVSFSEFNKMSPCLVELRVDYHLNRIMKSYRLNNFANAIKSLPLQSRICEKLIEIVVRYIIILLTYFTCFCVFFVDADLNGKYDRSQVGKDTRRQGDA